MHRRLGGGEQRPLGRTFFFFSVPYLFLFFIQFLEEGDSSFMFAFVLYINRFLEWASF